MAPLPSDAVSALLVSGQRPFVVLSYRPTRLAAAAGSLVGVAVALKVRQKDAVFRYAAAAAGAFGWTGLAFSGEPVHLSRRSMVLGGSLSNRSFLNSGLRVALLPPKSIQVPTMSFDPAVVASVEAGGVAGSLLGIVMTRGWTLRFVSSGADLSSNLHPFIGNLLGVVAYGIGGSLLGGLGQVVVDEAKKDHGPAFSKFLERFRLDDAAAGIKGQRNSVSAPNGELNEQGKRQPSVSIYEENAVLTTMDKIKAWWDANVEIPEWAYLRVEGPKEKILNAELARLESEIDTLRRLLEVPHSSSSS